MAKAEAALELVPDREPKRLTANETFFRAYRPAATQVAAQAAAQTIATACVGGAAECLQTELLAVASRAWRRNLQGPEKELLASKLALFQQEIGQEAGYAAALELVLASPRFLYLLEPGSLAADQASGGVHQGRGDRVAGMLAATLWASVPDQALLKASAEGRLDEPAGLAMEVQRMLSDNRARRGVATFFGSWLGYRQLEKAFKDEELFPGFDDAVRAEMIADTERTLQALFFDKNSGPDALLASTLGFPGENTIKLLGWQGVTPGEADLASVGRHGVATHPSILALTSGSAETSIVGRGKYFVETLACGHIPPPPVDVDANVDKIIENAGRPLSNREIAEIHRADPGCASCHRFLDPFGMAFENYDAIGASRQTDRGVAINTSVTVDQVFGMTGTFSGATELLDALKKTGTTSKCFATRLAEFIEPGPLSPAQTCALEALTVGEAGGTSSMSEIFRRFVTSEQFLNRSL